LIHLRSYNLPIFWSTVHP